MESFLKELEKRNRDLRLLLNDVSRCRSLFEQETSKSFVVSVILFLQDTCPEESHWDQLKDKEQSLTYYEELCLNSRMPSLFDDFKSSYNLLFNKFNQILEEEAAKDKYNIELHLDAVNKSELGNMLPVELNGIIKLYMFRFKLPAFHINKQNYRKNVLKLLTFSTLSIKTDNFTHHDDQ